MSSSTPSTSQLLAQLKSAADDNYWREAGKLWYHHQLQTLVDRFAAGESVASLIQSNTAAVDQVVVMAWQRAIPDGHMSLLATGGYGRGELYPQSDVDLLVLAEVDQQLKYVDEIGRFISLLWDIGISSGHAVRSRDECVAVAAQDITICTALMERRVLAGEALDLQQFDAVLGPDRQWPAPEYLNAKRLEQVQRHARFNDTVNNLEPNIKDGPGGLRDLHTIAWMGRRLYGVSGRRALVPIGVLGEDECNSLEREWAVLARLRFGLHLIAQRAEERLLFDHQKALAALLGLRDERADRLAVEQMMQQFYRAAQTVMRINDRLLQRFEEQLAPGEVSEPVAANFELRHGYLRALDPEQISNDTKAVFDVFEVWAQCTSARGLHSQTARAMAEALPNIKPYNLQTKAVRAKFLALLNSDEAVATLSRMAYLGVLARYLPEFAQVSGRMQYDLFHVYTVDQHTLTVLRIMAGFASGADPRFSKVKDVWPRLRKPVLLLIAGLFHDIAKGRGGDHSELGAQDVRAFALAHELPVSEVELLGWLVAKHLLMSTTAQRQDISDPQVITRFSQQMEDRSRLDYLYLLTCADVAGTSPKLWNAWKDQLFGELYESARFVLRRGLENPVHGKERVEETRNDARKALLAEGLDQAQVDAVWAEFPDESFLRYRVDQIVWQTRGIAMLGATSPACVLFRARPGGSFEAFVYAPNRDGLFFILTATLDRLGFSVLAARIVTSTSGRSLDTFQLIPHSPLTQSTEQVISDSERVLLQMLQRPSNSIRLPRRALPRHLKHFKLATRIEFENDPVSGLTRMILMCTDRPGLLAMLGKLFRDYQLRVHDARIATFGERVEDIFILSDQNDRAIPEGEQLEALREALNASLETELP